MAQVLEKELETFYKHKDSLLATDEGKYVLIYGDQLYGTFDFQLRPVGCCRTLGSVII